MIAESSSRLLVPNLLNRRDFLANGLYFYLSKYVIGSFKPTAGLSHIKNKKHHNLDYILTHISDFKFVFFQ